MRAPPLVASSALAAALAFGVSAEREARADVVAIHADGFAGYTRYSRAGPGLTLGADVMARFLVFQAGLLADSTAGAGTGGNGSETVHSLAATAGLAFYGKHLGLDVLGVVGAHVYDNVATGLYTSGVNASAPFAQARVGLNFLEFRPLTLGLWAYAGDDLSRSSKSYVVPSPLTGEPTATQQVTIGESSWGFAFRIGVDFGL